MLHKNEKSIMTCIDAAENEEEKNEKNEKKMVAGRGAAAAAARPIAHVFSEFISSRPIVPKKPTHAMKTRSQAKADENQTDENQSALESEFEELVDQEVWPPPHPTDGNDADDHHREEGADPKLLSSIAQLMDGIEKRICAGILSHQTESFEFIYEWINDIIMTSKPLRQAKDGYLHQLKPESVTFMPPTSNHDLISPILACERQLTYCKPINSTILYTVHRQISRQSAAAASADEDIIEHDNHCFEREPCWTHRCEPTNVGALPLMTQAKGCLEREGQVACDSDANHHYGGNFIISGSCKVMSPSERLHTNYPLLFHMTGSYTHCVEFRSSHHLKPHRSSSNTILKISRYNRKQPSCTRRVMVGLPYIKDSFPIMVLFMALGWNAELVVKGVRHAAGNDFYPEFLDILENVLYTTGGCHSQRDALLSFGLFAKKDDLQDEDGRISFALHTLRNEVLPHLGHGDEVNEAKAMQLCDLLWRLMMFACPDPADPEQGGRMQMSDRDDQRLKRYDSPASLIANLVCQLWRITLRKADKTFRDFIQKDKPVEIAKIFNGRNTTPRLLNCIGTGLWSAKKTSNKKRTGMSQAQCRMNVSGTLAQLRRVHCANSNNDKQEKRRKIAKNSYKRICPSETPEGSKVGIVKHLATGARISVGSDHCALARILLREVEWIPLTEASDVVMRGRRNWGTERHVHCFADIEEMRLSADGGNTRRWWKDVPVSTRSLTHTSSSSATEFESLLASDAAAAQGDDDDGGAGMCKIFFNGIWYGWVRNPEHAEQLIREKRRCLSIDPDTSVRWNRQRQEVRIGTDAGRILRPLALPKAILRPPADPIGSAYNLLQVQAHGLIEFIDAEEEQELRVAHTAQEFLQCEFCPTHQFTHCEIDPDQSLGVSVGTIVFPAHNQCCRNTYQAAMGKQAAMVKPGQPRGDTSNYVLDYGQRPLTFTKTARHLDLHRVQSGINVNVMIACDRGYNIEDAISMSKTLIDNRAFSMSLYRRYVSDQVKHGSTNNCEVFEKPTPESTRCLRNADYERMDHDGLVPSGTFVHDKCMIVGKTSPSHHISNAARANLPRSMRAGDAQHKRRDVSKSLRKGEKGVVVQTMVTTGRKMNLRVVNVIVRIEKKPQIGDKFSCYTPDHEILTSEGWVPVADVTTKHAVATLNPATECVSYEHAEDVHAYDVTDERLYEVETGQVSLRTTLNHNMYVKKRKCGKTATFELEQAQRMNGQAVRFKKNCKNGLALDQVREAPFPASVVTAGVEASIAFVQMCGLVLRYGTRDMVSITLSCGVPGFWDTIQVIEACGTIKPSTMAGSDLVMFSHDMPEDMYAFLGNLAGRYYSSNNFPSWCFELDRAKSVALLRGLTDTRYKSFKTESIQFADSVQRLALNAGMSATAKQVRKVTPQKSGRWKVDILPRKLQNEPPLNSNTSSSSSSMTEHVTEPWTGTVHCVTVPGGILYVRRRGKAVWCGNSRHGQKGTVGTIVSREDMMFNSHGEPVDIIINPHFIPTRKTMGQLLEGLFGKAVALSKEPREVRSFGNDTDKLADEAAEVLKEYGFAPNGKETFYDGKTGEPIQGLLCTQRVYYQRLWHLVDNKKHARGRRGPMQILTRQPREGRVRDGGLRFGYMENDAYYAQGVASMHQERMIQFSDEFKCYVCKLCGFIGEANPEEGSYFCRHCQEINTLLELEIPYGFKLVMQELYANGMTMRLDLQEIDDDELAWCPKSRGAHPQLFRVADFKVDLPVDEMSRDLNLPSNAELNSMEE